MPSKAQRASTWNEIEALQSKQMIEQAKKTGAMLVMRAAAIADRVG